MRSFDALDNWHEEFLKQVHDAFLIPLFLVVGGYSFANCLPAVLLCVFFNNLLPVVPLCLVLSIFLVKQRPNVPLRPISNGKP